MKQWQRILRRLAGGSALWLLALYAPSAHGQLQLVTRAVPSPEAIERGKATFVQTCGFCHGTSARGGDGGPDLVRSPIVLDDEQGDQIGPVILNGRQDRGMPSFSLTREQIADIAAFLREQTQAAANRRDYKIQNVVTGDAKAGGEYFNGAGKCNSCHSLTGDFAKIGTRYDEVTLEARFLYPRPRAKITRVTITKPGAPPVTGIVEFMDDFIVGLRDAEGYYHSYSRADVKAEIQDPLAAHADLLRRYSDADVHNLLAYLVTLK